MAVKRIRESTTLTAYRGVTCGAHCDGKWWSDEGHAKMFADAALVRATIELRGCVELTPKQQGFLGDGFEADDALAAFADQVLVDGVVLLGWEGSDVSYYTPRVDWDTLEILRDGEWVATTEEEVDEIARKAAQ